MARMARFFDATKCIACRGCQVACKQWNQLPGEIGSFTGTYQSHNDLSTNRWTMIRYYEHKDSQGEMKWDFIKQCCLHCGDPSCVKACPNDALRKTDNGTVVTIRDNCVGCGYCATYCPFNIPKVDKRASKMFKCTSCTGRIRNNMEPACAKTCVTKAIVFGSRDDLVELAKARLQEVKGEHPQANLYGIDELDGLGMIYLLPDRPSKFNLPENPQVPLSLTLLKNIAQPAGSLALAGTVVGLAGAALISWRNERMKGGDKKND
ncbi:4Fe-4S dicluster domain-containing protein [Heliorestis acidaminivorans]|uniref:4Fe-4S dicluster domain-containing protein n=1 Tax=Heliorestis acidaminivorans TaxID=553427 RepID=A0A6I0ETH4_9FIRM|nr:4Fe-4S dicluster domain-containing protein [Heliorestis acidaminivorans]KAB2953379.1 4Fe-4S dicluster domain-containing protein [Heliorestis acidaminivorans]